MRVAYVVRREQVDVSRVTMRDERLSKTSGTGESRIGVNGAWGGVWVTLGERIVVTGKDADVSLSAERVALPGATGHARVGLERGGLDASLPCSRTGSNSPISESAGKFGELLDAYGTGGRGGDVGDAGSSSSYDEKSSSVIPGGSFEG